ncbi:hypothetical protein AB852_19255 [Streptomyces uncialis]|uniref:Uncharacterized protein n=1 Tax=Streptomyces uncialis TaxID=1048205 RepID=A0A1Q4V6X2_9ACTN|nr:hypothetical protein AB852_19255 [Streptomyces uncialis]
MTPALASDGFHVQVFHVFTAMALPNRVVSRGANFRRGLSAPGLPHGSSTSTGGNVPMCRFTSSPTEGGMSTVRVFAPLERAKYSFPLSDCTWRRTCSTPFS